MRGPVLLLCHQADPFAEQFHRVAKRRGVEVWQPSWLGDIAWSVDPLGDVDVLFEDLARGRSWTSTQLSGLWFQGLPPSRSRGFANPRSDSYVSAEVLASWVSIGRQLSCPAVGLPAIDQPTVGPGLSTRVELRRLGYKVLKDALVLGSTELQKAPAGARTWVTTWSTESGWASDLPADKETAPAATWGTTLLDDRRVLAIVRVDQSVRAIKVDGDRWDVAATANLRIPVESAMEVGRNIGSRLGVTLFARQGGRWTLARHILQVPYWLREGIEPWLSSQLIQIFAADE